MYNTSSKSIIIGKRKLRSVIILDTLYTRSKGWIDRCGASSSHSTAFHNENLCSDWARSYGPKWSLYKCAALRPWNTTSPPLILENQVIEDEKDTEYLDVSLTYGGTSLKRGLERMETTMNQLGALKSSHRKSYLSIPAIKMVTAFVLPKFE